MSKTQELLSNLGKLPEHNREFARSLCEQLNRRGSLSDKQWPHFDRLHKLATDEAPAYVKPTPTHTFPKLRAMFGKAEHVAREAAHGDGEGFKWPRLHLATASGFKFKVYRTQFGKHPDALQVKEYVKHTHHVEGAPVHDSAHWFGRVEANGDWYAARGEAHAHAGEVVATLAEIEADPENAMRLQGQRTSRCCMCGLELTNEVSRRLGIGPICRAKWF